MRLILEKSISSGVNISLIICSLGFLMNKKCGRTNSRYISVRGVPFTLDWGVLIGKVIKIVEG